VSTDLHGNGDDLRALTRRFDELRAVDEQTCWLLLGDLVHAPDDAARAEQPGLYDFADESWEICEEVIALRRQHPGRVWLILGNHDHGHVGGRHTSKFHRDEVRHLEEQLTSEQRAAMKALFEEALLLAVAPCGVLLAHGSPGAPLTSLAQVERLSLVPGENDDEGAQLLSTLLTSYGQRAEVSAEVLRRVGASAGLQLGVVVHGHDRDEAGWFSEGEHQLCPVLFGAPRENKRYLQLDLVARYDSVAAIRDGVELRRLHEPGP